MDLLAERKTKTVYKENNRSIKLFIENYSKSNILNEALNQARVEETGLNIPKLLEVTKMENRWALISEYIEGKSLDELMNEHPEKQEEYMNMFIEIQLNILSKKSPMLNNLKEKMKRKIAETDLSDTIKYDLNTRLESMPKHNNVCHGDFNPSNIIIKEDGTAYIIDWAHASQGNSSADAARTYLIFNLEGKKEKAEEYLNKFSEKSGIEKKYIQKWIPIVAAAHLSKASEEEKTFLINWIDVVDYA